MRRFPRQPANSIVRAVVMGIGLLNWAGCGGHASSPPYNPSSQASSPTTPKAAQPSSPRNTARAPIDREFLDRLDREVTVPVVPQRVISLSPETTELLFAIGAGQQLVGVTDYCNYPEAAVKLPKIGGGTLETLSLEAIVALQPDLVLCKWDSHQPLIDRLQQVGIQSFAVGPTGLASLYDEADQLGHLLGCHERAASWVIEMKRRIEAQRIRVPSVDKSKRLKVFYQVWHEPLMSVNDASFIGEVLRLAGLVNVFSDLDAPFPTVSPEAVLQRNPDVILAPKTEGTTVADLLARPGWSPIRAVQDQRVYLINPDTISRCGPRLADALKEIVDLVHGGDQSAAKNAGRAARAEP